MTELTVVPLYTDLAVGKYSKNVQISIWCKAETFFITSNDASNKCSMAQSCTIITEIHL